MRASIRFPNIGLDSEIVGTARPRLITFTTDGPGVVRAAISDVSAAAVEICLWEGGPGDQDEDDDLECAAFSDQGALTRTVDDDDEQVWTVRLQTAEAISAPTAALSLRFPSEEPRVSIRGFRFQGTAFPEYNGVEVVVTASADEIELSAEWSGGSQPYRVSVDDIDAGEGIDGDDGEADGVDFSTDVTTESRYRVELANEVEFSEVEAILRASISW